MDVKPTDRAPSGQKCTWAGCSEAQAVITLLDKKGVPWAHLCQAHYDEHDKSMSDAVNIGGKDNIKKMMGAWVKAKGGAKVAAEAVMR